MKKILITAILALTTLSAYAADKTASQTVDLSVTEKGFEPNTIDVKPGTNVILKVTRKTDSTCAKEIQIPSIKIKKELPLNKTVSIEVGKLEKGEIRFGCGMNMMEGGKIFVK